MKKQLTKDIKDIGEICIIKQKEKNTNITGHNETLTKRSAITSIKKLMSNEFKQFFNIQPNDPTIKPFLEYLEGNNDDDESITSTFHTQPTQPIPNNNIHNKTAIETTADILATITPYITHIPYFDIQKRKAKKKLQKERRGTLPSDRIEPKQLDTTETTVAQQHQQKDDQNKDQDHQTTTDLTNKDTHQTEDNDTTLQQESHNRTHQTDQSDLQQLRYEKESSQQAKTKIMSVPTT
mmetsp:Transcript_12157/g.17464  ORF Transcript_12157/g.17464 Transcript_12157/m.17464 type:complete len:237 (-) Transcript_12157:748-1458(-)|eukprot:CAMPEP_0202457134 /NCGR_PEP_ID=MMETSP1360-20130828/14219_1 /ASSEMBLY_ACC=CAM_ASM_000848 /TAXON_ID=515479 /ORGANISM="Licmophora paradoxa, Strain CCMP2313" /LENGTH=236 /DNA_ID=CAMNT_0049077127 /DNA_START=346 /DNA_END=1056 /DNA_ORIENTATION=-